MISERKDYSINCDTCHEPMQTPFDEPIMVAHRGHIIYEDTVDNIKLVAVSKGWKINMNRHTCPKCD